jgi:putative spermidine/putrescine transport system substrate-binding protein
MAWMLKPDQQAYTYDTGYFYPGPAIKNVPITSAPAASQSVNSTYGDPKFDALVQSTPVKAPLSAANLVAAFNKWDSDINAK